MSGLQKVAALCLLASVLVMGLWAYKGVTTGFKLATPEGIMVKTKSVDEFGDEVETMKLVENPDKLDIGLDLAGPISGVFGALAVGLFLLDRKKRG
jgi:hypothetical protein